MKRVWRTLKIRQNKHIEVIGLAPVCHGSSGQPLEDFMDRTYTIQSKGKLILPFSHPLSHLFLLSLCFLIL
jgi:hypothetical protein